jgi:hypothetical protein
LPWFAPKQARGVTAPTRRAINMQVGGEKTGRWVEPMNSFDAVSETLKRRRRKRKQERYNVKGARR